MVWSPSCQHLCPSLGLPALVGCCRWAEIQGFRSHLCLRLRAAGSPGESQPCRSFFLCPSTVPGTWGLTWLNECAPSSTTTGRTSLHVLLHTAPPTWGFPGSAQARVTQMPSPSPGLPKPAHHQQTLFLSPRNCTQGLPTHLAPPSKYLTIYTRTLILWSKNVLSRFCVMS